MEKNMEIILLKNIIIVAIVLIVLIIMYLFLIAPRMFNKADRTPLYGVHYAHRGLFDNKTS